MILSNKRTLQLYFFPQGATIPFTAKFIYPVYADAPIGVYDYLTYTDVPTAPPPPGAKWVFFNFLPTIDIIFYMLNKKAFALSMILWKIKPVFIELYDANLNDGFYDLQAVVPFVSAPTLNTPFNFPQVPVSIPIDIFNQVYAATVKINQENIEIVVAGKKDFHTVTTKKIITLAGLENQPVTMIEIATNNNIPEYNKQVGMIV